MRYGGGGISANLFSQVMFQSGDRGDFISLAVCVAGAFRPCNSHEEGRSVNRRRAPIHREHPEFPEQGAGVAQARLPRIPGCFS